MDKVDTSSLLFNQPYGTITLNYSSWPDIFSKYTLSGQSNAWLHVPK